jgi:hypothetical protein
MKKQNKIVIKLFSILTIILLELNCSNEGIWDSFSNTTGKPNETSNLQTDDGNIITDLEIPIIDYAEGDTIDRVSKNIVLTSIGKYGSKIAWESEFPQIITNDGIVTRPDFENEDAKVKLIATATIGTKSDKKEFLLTVIKEDPTDTEAVTADLDTNIITYAEGDTIDSVTQNIALSNNGEYGSVISWVSDNSSTIETDGTVVRPNFIDGVDRVVKMTATTTKGVEIDTREFTITVIRKPPTNTEVVADTIANTTFISYAVGDTINKVTQNVTLTKKGTYGSTITWASNKTEYISINGGVTRTVFGTGMAIVNLTATISKKMANDTKEFYLIVMEDILNPETAHVVSLSINGVPFNMMYIEGGLKYLATHSNNVETSVENPFFVAETELTYRLWFKVGQWAIDHGYIFQQVGQKGGGSTPKSNQHPVTNMNWRDAMIWTNALTEYHNEIYNTNLQPFFYSDASYTMLIKDSTDATCGAGAGSTDGDCDNPYIYADTNGNLDILNSTASGYRLLTSAEWELAARYQGDDNSNDAYNWPISAEWWTKGDYASGATADTSDAVATALVSVYDTSGTAEVKSKLPNLLGLYDMSGNIREWVFDKRAGGQRAQRDSPFGSDNTEIQIANNSMTEPPYSENSGSGFRIARSR